MCSEPGGASCLEVQAVCDMQRLYLRCAPAVNAQLHVALQRLCVVCMGEHLCRCTCEQAWICNSSICMTRRGLKPTGIAIFEAKGMGYASVAHYVQVCHSSRSDL